MHLDKTEAKRVIVTDSIGDLDPNFVHDNHIVVIPIYITVDGVEYFDKLTMNNEILFDLIPQATEYPTTATPAVKYVHDLMKRLSEKFEEVLVITVAKKLSATHQILADEAKILNDMGRKVYVIDSLNNSATEGLLVKKAIDMHLAGEKTEDIVMAIEEAKKKTNILVCLNTFKYAMMSGRLPKVVGKIGNFIGMRPIMTLDKEGHGAAFGMAFSKKGITKKILKIVKKDMAEKGIESYALVHCLNQELLDEYEKKFTEVIGKAPAFMTEVSSAVAIHSGIGTVAIGYITN
jgi:hypothetical protein